MCMSFVERVLLEAKAVAIEECLCAQQVVDGHHVGGAAFLAKDQNTVLHHLTVVFAVVGIGALAIDLALRLKIVDNEHDNI